MIQLALAALLGALPWAASADEHPELSAADEAYSAEKFEQAAALYRKDAELGVIAAQVNLAFMYLDGQGVAQDYQQALAWFQRAAEQGNAEAQQNVGMIYMEGKGVAKSLVDADKWFIIAGAKENSATAEKGMTQDQVAQANRLASEWLKKSNNR